MSLPMPQPEFSLPNFLVRSVLQQWLRRAGFTYCVFRRRALDESAAEHARLPRWRIVEYASLAGRHALLACDQFDFITAFRRAQPRRLRRAGRTHPHEHLKATVDRAVERTVADPVHVA